MKWPEIIAQLSAVRQQLDRLWCALRSLLARGVRCVRHYYRLAAEQYSLLLAGQPVVPLILKLAAKNLFHDRLRFIATVIGIVFSIVLVTVQMGLFLSFERMVTTMIDHAPADLWIVPLGTKCFEDPSLLDERERFRAMAIEGVSEAVPILIGFAEWRVPSGGTTPVFIIGSDPRTAAACIRGTLSKAVSTRFRSPMPWRSTDRISTGSGHAGSATAPKSAIRRCAGGGDHQWHPLVHDDALCIHDARPRAGLYGNAAEQGYLFSRPSRRERRRRQRSQPTCRRRLPKSRF